MKTRILLIIALFLTSMQFASAQTIGYIGSDSTVNSGTGYPAPYGQYYTCSKHQMLILSSELIAAGLSSGSISSLGFDVQAPNGVALQDFTIKIKMTGVTSLTDFDNTGLTTVYGPQNYVEGAGWNIHNFGTTFFWDGTSNLLVETCFCNGVSNWTANAIMYHSTTGFSSTVVTRTDGDASHCSNATFPDSSFLRPNMRIEIGGVGCTLTGTTSSTDETTAGANNGTATVTASLGTPPYTYLWSTGATTASITGLAPGNYTILVIDNTGCTYTASVTINAAGACPAPTSSFSYSANLLAVTFANSSSTTGTVTYAWTFGDGNTSASANPNNTYAVAGTYTVCLTVTDNCGTDMDCQTIIVVATGGGCTLVATAVATDETSSNANDGTGTVTATGGTLPYIYSWSDPGNQTNATAFGLAPGTYTVTVIDDDSCIATATITVGAFNCQLLLSLTSTNETGPNFNDGTVTATTTGGTSPLTYIWSNGGSSSTITVGPGFYSVTVIDANGCTASGTAPPVQAFVCTLSGQGGSTDEDSTGAFNGKAWITASFGTPPYFYMWSTFETTDTIQNLSAGFYDVTVTDANGCTYTTTIAVNVAGCTLNAVVSGTNESQAGANNGTATVSVLGGTAPYFILWDNLATTNVITNLAPGDYTVQVTDSAGCLATGTYTVQPAVFIGIIEQLTRLVTVKVYPNPAADLINFEITGTEYVTLHVFDFAGRQVKTVEIDQTLTEINTRDLGNGMYFYQLIGQGSEKLSSGKFVILK